MDAATVFVVIITAFAVAILGYLELQSRRSKKAQQSSLPNMDGKSES